jgi:UDP-N-acetylmuramyl pentapeptide phosphotransferase/UDP-N-acetylglucosamine-1-phosphate transferase
MTKTHRVGTITLGGMLIIFGVLFLLRLFIPGMTYDLIFRLWPLLFLFLGGEILIANFRQQDKLVYDKTAFVLIILLTFFAMGMAIVDFCINTAYRHINFY